MPTPKLCPPSPPCHNNLQFTAQCTAPCFIFTCHFTTKHHKAHRFLLLLLLLHPTHCTPDAAETVLRQHFDAAIHHPAPVLRVR